MNSTRRQTLRRLLRYFGRQRATLAVAMAGFLLASLTEPLIPKLLQVALDEGFLAEPKFDLWLVPVTLIGLFLLRGVLGYVGQFMLSRATSRVTLDMRSDLAGAMLEADAALFSRLPAGVVVSKIISDPQTVSSQLGSALLTLLRDGTTAIALLAYLLWLNWQLTLLAFVTLPLLVWGLRKVQKRFDKVSRANYDAQTRLAAAAEDLARSWRVIRTFGAGAFERKRFGTLAGRAQSTAMKTVAASAAMSPLSQLTASIGVALIVTVAMAQVRAGEATVGMFAGYIAALLLLVSRTRHLAEVSQPILYALTVADGCFELLSEPREQAGGRPLPQRATGAIEFDDVAVRYPGAGSRVLDGLNLVVEAGSTVALVGSSGGGKSTVIHALLGFVPCESGQIRLDGHDVATLARGSLREQFSVVSQDVLLFDASIAENVVYAGERDETRLRESLEAAALWDFVQTLPEGVETRIGTNGSQLSGGQRQRVAIARALYKDAPIWIFDEATSALDGESERAVLSAIQGWHGRKTMILIAHRLSTIQRADRIHVLQDGRIVESGRHDDLLRLGAAYARAVTQLEAEPDGAVPEASAGA